MVIAGISKPAYAGVCRWCSMPPHRRLSDLLQDAEFLLVQLVVFHQSTSEHHSAGQEQKLAELHRRLDNVERQLRLHAAEMGIDEHATLSHIRRELASLGARRPYRGPERRAVTRKGAARR